MNTLIELPEIRDVPEVDEPPDRPVPDSARNADDQTIARLAGLPLLEYERQREKVAKQLGCRAPILDKLVDARRSKKTDASLQGSSVNFPEIEPWPEPVDGTEMLNQISQTFSRYIVLPDGASDVLALWCAHTHVFKAFICSPRLNISSPDKRCGKTTLRDVAALFVSRPVLTENLSVAVLFRLVQAHAPTILADEYDAWLRNNEELRGLLNAGHRHGATVYRCEGEGNEVRSFAAYCPAVLCGIGTLPGTLHDRSIVIRLERAKPDELPELFDPRRTDCEQELCRKLVRWCADNFARLESTEPVLPKGMFNRMADNWRPLFAVADVAGGDWPERLLTAVTTLLSRNSEENESVGMKTLSAIKIIFDSSKADRLATKDILHGLVETEDGPWAGWWEHDLKNENTRGPAARLARLLKPYGIKGRGIRLPDSTTPRGYMREDFEEAWKRYCPPKPSSGCNDAT
jgi:putative DNA primase/helicase